MAANKTVVLGSAKSNMSDDSEMRNLTLEEKNRRMINQSIRRLGRDILTAVIPGVTLPLTITVEEEKLGTEKRYVASVVVEEKK